MACTLRGIGGRACYAGRCFRHPVSDRDAAAEPFAVERDDLRRAAGASDDDFDERRQIRSQHLRMRQEVAYDRRHRVHCAHSFAAHPLRDAFRVDAIDAYERAATVPGGKRRANAHVEDRQRQQHSHGDVWHCAGPVQHRRHQHEVVLAVHGALRRLDMGNFIDSVVQRSLY